MAEHGYDDGHSSYCGDKDDHHTYPKPHQYTDSNKLPFGANSGKVRAPNVTREQYRYSLFPPKYGKVMLAGPIPDGLKLAQATLPETPNAPDTAATDDAQITPAIKSKATELNNNPVQIYNWVRNNIAFIPSYGSIQGSDMTLQNKRGNPAGRVAKQSAWVSFEYESRVPRGWTSRCTNHE